MKKSEFKEYLKTEILKMNEAEIEVDSVDKAADVAKEIPDAKIKLTGENIVKLSEFKKFLRQEILSEIAGEGLEEAEEEEVDVEAEEEVTPEPDAATFDFDQPDFGTEGDVDEITDGLVKLAKQAKEAGQLELANQILNSAKFSAKTEFKKIEKEA